MKQKILEMLEPIIKQLLVIMKKGSDAMDREAEKERMEAPKRRSFDEDRNPLIQRLENQIDDLKDLKRYDEDVLNPDHSSYGENKSPKKTDADYNKCIEEQIALIDATKMEILESYKKKRSSYLDLPPRNKNKSKDGALREVLEKVLERERER